MIVPTEIWLTLGARLTAPGVGVFAKSAAPSGVAEFAAGGGLLFLNHLCVAATLDFHSAAGARRHDLSACLAALQKARSRAVVGVGVGTSSSTPKASWFGVVGPSAGRCICSHVSSSSYIRVNARVVVASVTEDFDFRQSCT